MRKLFLVILLFFSYLGYAQHDIKVPVNYKLENKADYTKYEEKFIECVDWLLNTPVDKHEAKRKEVNAFLIAWMAGSPDVSIELTAEVVSFAEQADALIIFMAAWTKYAIQTKNYDDILQLNLHGIKAVITLYKRNKKQMGECIPIEQYIEMEENGLLEAQVNKRLQGQ